jgi:hypothetical protein
MLFSSTAEGSYQVFRECGRSNPGFSTFAVGSSGGQLNKTAAYHINISNICESFLIYP